MCQSMFDRLLALFMAVILLMALISAGFSVLSIREAMVNSRMEGLLVQAREIAYLAANLDSSSIWITDDSTMKYLQWKARSVYEAPAMCWTTCRPLCRTARARCCNP